ncbi:MAG: pyruvate ferredoxin oxidoreductase [Gammaproteobacteria bacterium]|nr:pyruvate ferredoxin oxidoreductase [Gammaproteobacteria bacterium]
MTTGGERILLSGNHAVSWGARLARPAVIPLYPITPQTPILEKLTDFHAAGELDAEILTPESEHSAMAACIAASLTGVRVFTATASQGLLLMHELLHYASGARAPIVMCNVNRTVASPWGFWPDQTDSLAQRDTGWMQFYTESGQESLDTVIQAFRIAEQVMIPVMINQDAFYVSHALEPVDVPAQSLVDRYLPPYAPEHFLDPDRGESWGNLVNQELYNRHRKNIGEAMNDVLHVAADADAEWRELTGRGYGVIEEYRCDGAGTAIVTMGSMCGTAREAVDRMRANGRSVGLVKVRLFRPLPGAALRALLAKVDDVVVLDRNFSPGVGGVLHQELRSALYGLDPSPRVHGFLAGVGGVNVSPGKIIEFVDRSGAVRAPTVETVWAG